MINLNKFMSCKDNDSKDIINRYAITKKNYQKLSGNYLCTL